MFCNDDLVFSQEEDIDMEEKKELIIRAGDFIKVKPYRSVRDPETGAVYGIPKNIYFDFEVNPPRVRSVKWHCGSMTSVSIVGYDEKWYQLTPDYIDGVISQSDSVNHPSHYNQNGMEVWDVIKAFTSDLNGAEAFYAGNIIKYVLRWNKKNGIEDLEKAKVYIDKIIEEEKKNKE